MSIEQQVNACRKYAEDNHLEILRIYDDHAMTGTNDQRPEFQQMIRDSSSGAFSYVIVYSLDRFSRDRYDSAVHKHTLKENGVRVVSAMENIQDNPTGVLMESVLEGFAEYYSKELAQKIRRDMLSNAEKCMVNGPLPLGYKKAADGKYEIVEREAQLIREIYTRVASGEPFIEIIDDLNRRGLLTKGGKKWCHNSFSKMLSQEKYIGTYRYKDIVIENGIPPIVEKELFDKVQERITKKPNARGVPQRRRRASGTYLLTGKLFCGECGSPMVGLSGTSKTNGLHFYYVCKGHREKHICSKKPVGREWAEDRIASLIHSLISSDEVVSWLADETLSYLQQRAKDDSEVNMLEERLARLKKEKSNTLHAVRMAPALQSLLDMLSEIEAEESSLTAKLALAKQRCEINISREDLIDFARSICSGDIKDKAYQQKLFDAFLVKAYLFDDHLRVTIRYSTQGDADIDIPINSYKPSQAPPKKDVSFDTKPASFSFTRKPGIYGLSRVLASMNERRMPGFSPF